MFDSNSLCPDCEVIRLPRCRHCSLCNQCVDRFDHHCPWIYNCVGGGNHLWFYLHVLTISVYSWMVLLTCLKILFGFNVSEFSFMFLVIVNLLLTLSLVFILPLTLLTAYQTYKAIKNPDTVKGHKIRERINSVVSGAYTETHSVGKMHVESTFLESRDDERCCELFCSKKTAMNQEDILKHCQERVPMKGNMQSL